MGSVVKAVPYDPPARARVVIPRGLRRALLIAALAYPIYLIVVNSLLALGVVQRVVNATDAVHVEFAAATSWFPGYIAAKDLSLRIEDKNVEAYLVLPHVEARIGLLALLRKELRVKHVRGTGARFYFRHKLARVDDANAARVSAYPSIPGGDPIPLAQAGPDAPWMSTDVNKLWKIELDDVESSVDELWFQEYRYRGRGYVKGAFRLEPMQRVWVGPATLDLEPGLLTAEPHVVATEIGGHLETTVHEFEVQKNPGAKPLSFVDARATLTGKLPDLSVVALYAGDGGRSGAPITGSRGQLRVDAVVTGGVFDEGTEVHVDMVDVAAAAERARLEGPFSASVRATARGKLTFGADTARLTLRLAGDSGTRTVGHVDDATARVEVDASDWDHVRVVGGKLHTTANVEDASDLGVALGLSALRGGHGSAVLDATLASDAVNAATTVKVEGLDVRLGDSVRMRADGTLRAQATTDPSFDTVELTNVRIDAPRVAFRGHGDDVRSTWIKAQFPRVRVLRGRSSCTAFSCELQAGNAAALAVAVDGAPLRALVGEFLKGSNLYVRAHGAARSEKVQVDFDHAEAGDVEGRGILVDGGGRPSGAFVAQAGGITSGVSLEDGRVSVKPLASFDWLDGRAAVLRGPACR